MYVCVCVSLGKRAVGASVGSAPLQEHHHPQPETGRGSVSTSSQSSSFYHTNAANTTGTHPTSHTHTPTSLCLTISHAISYTHMFSYTNTHNAWCLVSEEGKWQQMGEQRSRPGTGSCWGISQEVVPVWTQSAVIFPWPLRALCSPSASECLCICLTACTPSS